MGFRDRLYYLHSRNLVLRSIRTGIFSGQTLLFAFQQHRLSLVRAGLPSTVLCEEKNPVWTFKISSICHITVISATIVVCKSSGGRILLLVFFLFSSGESA